MASPRKVRVEIYSSYCDISNNKTKSNIIRVLDNAFVYYKGRKFDISNAGVIEDIANNVLEITPDYCAYELIFTNIPQQPKYGPLPIKEQKKLKGYLENRDIVNKKKKRIRERNRVDKEIGCLEKRLKILNKRSLSLMKI